MLKKRGQITIFIIIGIFILVLSAIFLYLDKDRTDLTFQQSLPEEVVPIKNYVEECVRLNAEKAVLLLGSQGGYIYLPPMISANPNSYIPLVEGSDLKVPYWYYEGSSRAPTLDEMEEQISTYVKLNLRSCLDDFEPFGQMFNIEEKGNISVKTSITENNIILTTTYPLDVKPRGTRQSTRVNLYDAILSVKLKRVHKLAAEILTSENKNMFLEKLTIDLMTLGPDIPFTDMLLTCKKLRWYKSEVADKVKNLLYYNLPRVRFQDTKHEPFQASISEYEKFRYVTPEDIRAGQYPRDAPGDLYDYYHFFWDASDSYYPDLQANLYYQKDWRFDFNARPSDGEVMDSSLGRGMEKYLKFLCLNIYHFTYDVIYPVQVVIQDESAFSGKGFTFRYAVPVMINHNQGQREPFGISVFESPKEDADYCTDLREEEIRIYAKNKNTFDDIKDVNLTFNCMNTYYCDIGKTDREAGVYRLKTNLPSFCRPGSIEAEKAGYLKAIESVPISSFMDIYMTPLKYMDFKVVKRRHTVDQFQDAEPLRPSESAVIYITTDNATDYDVYLQYPPDPESPPELRFLEILMDDITYNLDIALLQGDKVIGGYRGEWVVDYDDTANSREVVFVAMEKIPHPVSDDQQASLMMDLQNPDYADYLQPIFR
jgi:hypothetical protein